MESDWNGTKRWYKDGRLHRDDDKPAIEWADGSKEWYANGENHRDNDKPAIEWADGRKEWYVNGKRHRDSNKPALAGGARQWWVNDKRHRDNDKPAVEWKGRTTQWWVDGRRHRAGGRPAAIEWADDEKRWYVGGHDVGWQRQHMRDTMAHLKSYARDRAARVIQAYTKDLLWQPVFKKRKNNPLAGAIVRKHRPDWGIDDEDD